MESPGIPGRFTLGVKRLMGLIAKQLHEHTAGSRFGKTNLQEFLR